MCSVDPLHTSNNETESLGDCLINLPIINNGREYFSGLLFYKIKLSSSPSPLYAQHYHYHLLLNSYSYYLTSIFLESLILQDSAVSTIFLKLSLGTVTAPLSSLM